MPRECPGLLVTLVLVPWTNLSISAVCSCSSRDTLMMGGGMAALVDDTRPTGTLSLTLCERVDVNVVSKELSYFCLTE